MGVKLQGRGKILASLAALRAKVMGAMDFGPGVALSESGNPRANFRDTFGVVILPRFARNQGFVIENFKGHS